MEIADEAQLIKVEEAWPLWPVLPVKNIHRDEPDWPEDESHGIITAGLSNCPTYVHLINVFLLKDGGLGPQLEGVRHIEYPSVEDAVRAGWIGD